MKKLTVWCEDASHPLKRERVFLTEFVESDEPGQWVRLTSSRRDIREAREAREVADDKWGLRQHRVPGCPFCKNPLTVRTGKLDAVFDMVAATGRADVTLSELRAILEQPRK